ncbi:hypothetical protein EKO04_003349 [Ascochyta lentis]|uniref:Uncharacterized protein n=1 Tax=Ascochyta lentis TaxID=205686 RepID=A0A8H7JAR0_9PLEO|nr:hypothetical protein EKO04_003349 [Ascochyta lentis]
MYRTLSPSLKITVPESRIARFKSSARLLRLDFVALQGALAAKAPDITYQSPENAPPIPYLNLMALFTMPQNVSYNSSKESGLLLNLFNKRQREEDKNRGLLCKNGPCPNKSKGSRTTKGRTVRYYLASNSRDCLCNRIFPKDIKAADYTHLFFSFASINPKTFKIRP